MSRVTSYSTLKSFIQDALWRNDLDEQAETFIQFAEAKFKDDIRLRKHADRGALVVSANGLTLPSDLVRITSWYHDGPTYYGPIEIVDVNQIPLWKSRYGSTGVPQVAAIVDNVARFGPVPDGSYTTYMTYWRSIQSLSDDNPTNWLLDERPDLYTYAALLEASPFLKDDVRIPMWQSFVEQAMDSVEQATQNKHFGGALRRQVPAIG